MVFSKKISFEDNTNKVDLQKGVNSFHCLLKGGAEINSKVIALFRV